MALKYIFNGYFRSGTTIIWDILRESNPGAKVFYEPLHDKLVHRIKTSLNGDDVIPNELHKKVLWKEYIDEGESFIKELQEKGFGDEIYPSSKEKLISYLNIYNNINSNVILQTNRLHFHIKEVNMKYDVEFFYIIRNPSDVYQSIMKIYSNSSRIKHFIKKIVYPIIDFPAPKSRAFKADKRIQYVYENFNIPECWEDKKKKRNILNDAFKTHLLSWLISNYYALKNCEKLNVKLIPYEKLISKPDEVKKLIENNSNLTFKTDKIIKRKVELEKYRAPKILETVKSLGVEEEYDYISNKVFNYNSNY